MYALLGSGGDEGLDKYQKLVRETVFSMGAQGRETPSVRGRSLSEKASWTRHISDRSWRKETSFTWREGDWSEI